MRTFCERLLVNVFRCLQGNYSGRKRECIVKVLMHANHDVISCAVESICSQVLKTNAVGHEDSAKLLVIVIIIIVVITVSSCGTCIVIGVVMSQKKTVRKGVSD